MYKSPIDIYNEIQTQIVQEDEKMIMEAIRKAGVNVDKAELIKALRYDRNQYTKGYEDGKNDVLDKIRAEIEEQVLESLSDGGDDWFTTEKVNECLEIIDKYREESEG